MTHSKSRNCVNAHICCEQSLHRDDQHSSNHMKNLAEPWGCRVQWDATSPGISQQRKHGDSKGHLQETAALPINNRRNSRTSCTRDTSPLNVGSNWNCSYTARAIHHLQQTATNNVAHLQQTATNDVTMPAELDRHMRRKAAEQHQNRLAVPLLPHICCAHRMHSTLRMCADVH
jgi:hypothetical protein